MSQKVKCKRKLKMSDNDLMTSIALWEENFRDCESEIHLKINKMLQVLTSNVLCIQLSEIQMPNDWFLCEQICSEC